MRFVRSVVIALISICCFCASVVGDNLSVRLLVGKREIPTAPAAIYDGARVLAPISVLSKLGISSVASSDGKTVSIIGQGEKTADVTVVEIDGQRMVSLDEVMKGVGGDVTVKPEIRAASIRANLTSLEFVEGTLRINCSMPVTCSVSHWSGRLIVDVPGTRLASEAREVYIGSDVVTRARLGQYSPDTSRVVIDLAKPAGIKVESSLPSAQLIVRVAEDIPLALPQPKSPPAGGQPFGITAIRVENVSDTRFDLVIETAEKGSVDIVKSDPPVEVTLILKGGRISQSVTEVAGEHPLLMNSRFAQASLSPPLSRVHMNLKRPVLAEVRVDEHQIRVGVRLPDKAGGKLADKLIVIDPGHGGKQPGAIAAGVKEKDVNLKLAAALAEELRKAGARTILTRTSDTTLDLAPRPAVATGNSGDFFISLHCNSNLKPDSNSGIETYYYRNGESSRLLAQAVQNAASAASRMGSRGIHDCGFKVLRLLQNTGIPGVLVECGYLNHSRDRAKLMKDDHRKKLAEGIVSGLRAYIEGTRP